jgi:hypothetical protein
MVPTGLSPAEARCQQPWHSLGAGAAAVLVECRAVIEPALPQPSSRANLGVICRSPPDRHVRRGIDENPAGGRDAGLAAYNRTLSRLSGRLAGQCPPPARALRRNKEPRGNKRTDWGKRLAPLCYGARRRTIHDLRCYTWPSRGWPGHDTGWEGNSLDALISTQALSASSGRRCRSVSCPAKPGHKRLCPVHHRRRRWPGGACRRAGEARPAAGHDTGDRRAIHLRYLSHHGPLLRRGPSGEGPRRVRPSRRQAQRIDHKIVRRRRRTDPPAQSSECRSGPGQYITSPPFGDKVAPT